MNRLLGVLLISIIASTAFATEVYRIVRPDGTVEFSDEPQLGAEKLKIPKIQSYSAPSPPPPAPAASSPGKPEQKGIQYTLLKITSPAYEETLFHDTEGVSVGVTVNPPLGEGDEIVITLDGGEAARGTGTRFTIKEVYRGSHTLKAIIEDKKGRIVKSSDPVIFFLRQYSR
jgi:hypothetical protein